MIRTKQIITNFTAGEISPLLLGRIDYSKYFNAATTIENFIITPFGAAVKMPGTYFVSEVKDSSKRVRLIPFIFSDEQAYILEFGDKYIRFYMDDGQIVDGATPYEITTPYEESDLFQIKYAQSFDVMYLVHPNYKPMKLSRYGHTNWTLTEVDFLWGPFLEDNSSSTSLSPSSTTGSITLTASSAIFESGHVGALWRIDTGYVKITSVTDSTHANADVIEELPSTSATTDWAEGAWSDVRGYPRAVTFYEQRLFFASTATQPQTVWASKIIEYENFKTGAEDADALSYTLGSEKANVILWLAAGKQLAVGTTGGVFSLSSGSTSQPLTPSNVVVHRETTYSAGDIAPIKVGNYVYFVQDNLRTVREYFYSFEYDSFIASDITLLAEHITKPAIVDIAYQQSPYNLLWAVRSDGAISILSRQVDQQVAGWSRITTIGEFESVAIIPNGYEDEAWVVVKRTINGATKRYVEYFKPFEFSEQSDAFFVHCGLTYNGGEATTISGLGHLEGEEVSVLTDGAVHPNVVVSSGKITLQWGANKVQVGLPYEAKIKTVPIELATSGGTIQGSLKRIISVDVRLYETLGLKVGDDDLQDEIIFRAGDDLMDNPPPLFTGDKRIKMPTGTDRAGQIVLLSDTATPATILAVMPTIEIGGTQ